MKRKEYQNQIESNKFIHLRFIDLLEVKLEKPFISTSVHNKKSASYAIFTSNWIEGVDNFA